jgi:hypothetical protein
MRRILAIQYSLGLVRPNECTPLAAIVRRSGKASTSLDSHGIDFA